MSAKDSDPRAAPSRAADPIDSPLFGLRVRIATLFGVGRFPIASGTVGSAATLPFALLLARLGVLPLILATVVVTLVGIWAAGAAERHYGVKDPSPVVVDEAAGQMVALVLLPPVLAVGVASFFLFRLFDVLKPPPARQLERIPGGAGIVLDDVAAGIYANLVLRAALLLATREGWL